MIGFYKLHQLCVCHFSPFNKTNVSIPFNGSSLIYHLENPPPPQRLSAPQIVPKHPPPKKCSFKKIIFNLYETELTVEPKAKLSKV